MTNRCVNLMYLYDAPVNKYSYKNLSLTLSLSKFLRKNVIDFELLAKDNGYKHN